MIIYILDQTLKGFSKNFEVSPLTYTIKLDVFEGPFDLLLHLIKINEMDIYDIKIAEITTQYLEYIEKMRQLDLEIAGEFIVMASTLIQLKARQLLPERESNEESQEDEIYSTEDLIKQLVEYRKFKGVSGFLKECEEKNFDIFTRDVPFILYEEQTDSEYRTIPMEELIDAFSNVLVYATEDVIHRIIREEFTLEEKIDYFREILKETEKISFNELINPKMKKLEIIVSFIALLELARLKEVNIVQKKGEYEIFIIRINNESPI